MRYIQKANTLTLLVQKEDAMACVVWSIFALTFCIRKTHAAFGREIP